MTTKNYGPGASGYLDPDGRSWETTVYQASKPILDKELNLAQDAEQSSLLTLQRRSFPSGWLSDNFLNAPTSDLVDDSSPVANILKTPLLWAAVNGWLVKVTNTNNNAGLNRITLSASPAGAGSKRTDFVFLEVWRRLIPAAPTATGKSAAARIWRDGNVKIASADDLTLNYVDDILDGAVGTETTKRVQIQYRIRTVSSVDLFTYQFGYNSPAVVANSVPASAAAPDGVASIYGYTNQSANGDPGLWRAGNGDPSNSLGTVDGYMYSIPLCGVFRRNTTAFNRLTNHNGGVALSVGTSDRPDGLYYDAISVRDVLDMRSGSAPSGWDVQEVLQKNMNFLFDNLIQTEIGSTLNGGGTDGHTVLQADEIGISNANGGDGSTNGDTPGADFIGEFDAVRRLYSDRPVYEVITLAYNPGDPGVSGGATWAVGTTITISPSALPIWPYAAFNWAASAPSGVSIVDVLRTVWSSATAAKKTFRGQENFRISGLGSVPQGAITARVESLTDGSNTATNETLYITILVAYPAGVGLTRTPTATYGSSASYKNGVFINNPGQLPAGSPIYYSQLYADFNTPNREIRLEYQTVSHTYSLRAGSGFSGIVMWMPERPVTVTSVTINGSPYGGSVSIQEYGIVLDSGAVTGGELVVVTYQSVRALPKNGEQLTVYYEARMPQTIREGLLPSSLDLTPRYVSSNMYALTSGSGANSAAFPFPSAYVQAGAVCPSSSSTFGGDHELDGDTRLSTTTLYADTGFMQLPIHVPIAPTGGIGLQRSSGDVDAEGRSFYKDSSNNYYMVAVGPTLSDPKKHKNLVPILCELPADSAIGYKGQLVLAVVSRWATFDDSNSVGFTGTNSTNTTAVSLYRVKGNLLGNRRV